MPPEEPTDAEPSRFKQCWQRIGLVVISCAVRIPRHIVATLFGIPAYKSWVERVKGWCIVDRETTLRRMVYAFLVEWALVPVIYLMGYHGMSYLSLICQAIVAVIGMSFQYRTVTNPRLEEEFRKEIEYGTAIRLSCSEGHGRASCPNHGRAFEIKNVYYTQREQLVETIMGVPVRNLGICNLHVWLVTLAPSCVNILSTSFAAGVAEHEWDANMQATWKLRWEAFGTGPGEIADFSGPKLLQLALLFLFLLRASCLYADDGHTRADSANLLLIEKLLLRGGEAGERRYRYMFLAIKVVMLWLKVSMLAMLYNRLSNSELVSLTVGVLLTFQTIVPLVQRAFVAVRVRDRCCMAACLPLQLVILLIALHFFGVFWCPSHDWSLVHGGCTRFFAINNTTS